MASGSVHALVDSMDAMIIKRKGSKYVNRMSDLVINWGCYGIPSYSRVLNSSEAVENATSKTRTFSILERAGIRVPVQTTDRAIAQLWAREGRILGRDLDRGSEGHGITVYKPGDTVASHKFYVKYVKKQREFRVHVFGGQVIDIQEKLKRKGGSSAFVRNTANGYVFVRGSLVESPCPASVLQAAMASVGALGLDFGGVDIGFHSNDGTVVYEVNTAPGIEGTTVQRYKEAIENAYSN